MASIIALNFLLGFLGAVLVIAAAWAILNRRRLAAMWRVVGALVEMDAIARSQGFSLGEVIERSSTLGLPLGVVKKA